MLIVKAYNVNKLSKKKKTNLFYTSLGVFLCHTKSVGVTNNFLHMVTDITRTREEI